jgi:hypothetical protein
MDTSRKKAIISGVSFFALRRNSLMYGHAFLRLIMNLTAA